MRPYIRWNYLDVSYPLRAHFIGIVTEGLEFSDTETRWTLTYV